MISLRRFWKYSCKVYSLDRIIENLRDKRIYPVISTRRVWLSVFFLFLLRFRSLNAWEQDSLQKIAWEKWIGGEPPSADAVGYVFCRFDCSGLREGLHEINTKLKRNKVLEIGRINELLVATIDGHELFSSFHRCCESCLVRRIKTKKGERLQYYHRIVVCQLVGSSPLPLLDMEMQLPGEDEVSAALRLLDRVCKRYPRYFQVLVMDGLYTQEPVINLALYHHKDVVIVLKNERRNLLQDARGLFKHLPSQSGRQGKTDYQLWDAEHFTTWTQINRGIRVVRSLEKETLRQKIRGHWQEVIEEHDWYWVTTLPQSRINAEGIREIGHLRWDIENQGFNELVNHWSMNHCWKHNPVAIESLILTMFWAYVLFHAFVSLNIKPAIRRVYSMLSIARLLYLSLYHKINETSWLYSAPG